MKEQKYAPESSASRRCEYSRRSKMPPSKYSSHSRAAKYSGDPYGVRFQKVQRSPDRPKNFVRPPLSNFADIEGGKSSLQTLMQDHSSLNTAGVHGAQFRNPTLYFENRDLKIDVDDTVKRPRKAQSVLKFVDYCTNFSNPQLKKPSHYFLHKYPMKGFHIMPHTIEEVMYPEKTNSDIPNPLNSVIHSIRTSRPERGSPFFDKTGPSMHSPEDDKNYNRRDIKKFPSNNERSPKIEFSQDFCVKPSQAHRRNQSCEAEDKYNQYPSTKGIQSQHQSPRKMRELPPLQPHNIELQKCHKKSHHKTKENVVDPLAVSTELCDNSFTNFYGKEPDKRELFYTRKLSEPYVRSSMNTSAYRKINIDKMLIYGGYQKKVIPTFYSQVPIGAGSNLLCDQLNL